MADLRENMKQENVSEVEINGIKVTLIFAAKKSKEIPFAVCNILRNSYLQRQNA